MEKHTSTHHVWCHLQHPPLFSQPHRRTWSEVKVAGAKPRARCCTTLFALETRVLMFGGDTYGLSAGMQSCVWRWRFQRKHTLEVQPAKRTGCPAQRLAAPFCSACSAALHCRRTHTNPLSAQVSLTNCGRCVGWMGRALPSGHSCSWTVLRRRRAEVTQ